MRTAEYLPGLIARCAAFTLCAAFIALPAWAEYKIATVDINRVLNESTEAKTKRKDLDQRQVDAKKKIEDKTSALRAMEKKLKEKNSSDTSKEAEDFRAEAKNLERLVKDSEEDLKKEFLKFNKSLTEKALKLVAAYAKTNKLDLVLDKGERGRGPILYGDASFDITDEVLKEMNQ